MVSGKAIWVGMGAALCLAGLGGNASVGDAAFSWSSPPADASNVVRRVFDTSCSRSDCRLCHQRRETSLAVGKRLARQGRAAWWEARKTERMRRVDANVKVFALMLVTMAVVCTIVWQLVGDTLYDCTDDNMLGFLRPGCWVHRFNGHSIVVVHQIVHGRSMGEPDAIKEGWSVPRLWCLWFSFVVGSLAVSFVFTWMIGIPRQARTAE